MPTKDRPHVIQASVTRVLSQTYQNIELIIADNSSDEQTRLVIEAIRDPRIKYVRTGHLSMAENWDSALASTTGDLVYIIADKLMLDHDAIQHLANFANGVNADAFTFSGNPRATRSRNSKKWQKLETRTLIESALSGDITRFHELGFHGYSLILSQNLLQKIRGSQQRVIMPISPDYTLAFIAALNTDIFYHLDWCPFHYASNSASNGFSSAYKGPLFHQFLADNKMTLEQTYEFAPIKVRTTWNCVLSDFFRVYQAIGKKPDYDSIDMPAYWKRLYSEVVYYASLTHIDMSEEFRNLFLEMEKNPQLQSEEINAFIAENQLATLAQIKANKALTLLQRISRKFQRLFSGN